MACCFWSSVWTLAYHSRMEVSKPRCISIRHTWCTHVALNNRCMYLHYINGSDNTTDFQQNPSPFLQGCVSHFRSFCLWLNFVDACSSFWVVYLHYMCICYGIVTLSLTQTDYRTLSRNSWVSLALHFRGNPRFMWLVSTEFPISLDGTFPSIHRILNAYSQHDGETCGGIGK